MRRFRLPAPRGFILAVLVSLALHGVLLWTLTGHSANPVPTAARFDVGLLTQGEATAGGQGVPGARMPAVATVPHRSPAPVSQPHHLAEATTAKLPPSTITAPPARAATVPEATAQATPAPVNPAGSGDGALAAQPAGAGQGDAAGKPGASVAGTLGKGESAFTPARVRSGYLDNPPPEYPTRSRELGEQGRVELKVRVGRDGRPLEVQIAHSSGFARLDRAAQLAVTQWRFMPAREGDNPVESWLIVPMPFRLN